MAGKGQKRENREGCLPLHLTRCKHLYLPHVGATAAGVCSRVSFPGCLHENKFLCWCWMLTQGGFCLHLRHLGPLSSQDFLQLSSGSWDNRSEPSGQGREGLGTSLNVPTVPSLLITPWLGLGCCGQTKQAQKNSLLRLGEGQSLLWSCVPCKAGNSLLWAWGQRSEGTGRLVALGAGHCADRAGISRGGGKKSHQIPRGICSPQTHRPGCSSLSYGNAAEMGFSFGLQVLPESLWGHGAVCVPCVLHVLLSAPGSASGFRFCSQPQMLSLRSEGQVQPPLLTSCSGFLPVAAHLALPHSQGHLWAGAWHKQPHMSLLCLALCPQHRPHSPHSVQGRADAAEPLCTPGLEEALASASQNAAPCKRKALLLKQPLQQQGCVSQQVFLGLGLLLSRGACPGHCWPFSRQGCSQQTYGR